MVGTGARYLPRLLPHVRLPADDERIDDRREMILRRSVADGKQILYSGKWKELKEQAEAILASRKASI